MRSSPPPVACDGSDYGDDIPFIPPADDDDTPMSDAPIQPSSPAAKAAERKRPDSEDDEEEFTVAEIKGNKNIQTAKVNITSSRPVKPVPLPTPGASSPTKAPAIDSSAWTNVSGGLNVIESSPALDKVSFGKLAAQDAAEDDGSVNMFWLDYSESNGSLLLFGKVKDKRSDKYVSAFLKVDGIMRNLLFLPREHRQRFGEDSDEEVQMEDVYQEVSDIMAKHIIDGFKTKPASRKYAFELAGIPREGDYLKVLYPYTSR
jgi:DNA polymerase alpha subunit A